MAQTAVRPAVWAEPVIGQGPTGRSGAPLFSFPFSPFLLLPHFPLEAAAMEDPGSGGVVRPGGCSSLGGASTVADSAVEDLDELWLSPPSLAAAMLANI